MTDEQKRFVEDNIRYVTYFIKKWGLDFDEWFGCLSECLCKAAIQYDRSKSEAATYLDTVFTNEVRKKHRIDMAEKRKHEANMMSLEQPVMKSDGETCSELKDLIDSKVDVSEEVVGRVMMDQFLEGLCEMDLRMLMMRLSGMKMQEIGDRMGCTRSNVSRRFKRLEKRFKEMYDD